MRDTWKVNVEGNSYNVVYKDRRLSVNKKEIRHPKWAKGSIVEKAYEVPLGNKTAILYIPASDRESPVLTIDGKNVITGEDFQLITVPKWGWPLVALYAINAIFFHNIVALVVWFSFGYGTCWMTANPKREPKIRVATSLGLYIMATILIGGMSLILAAMFGGAR